jgi:hypothetical protein
MTIRKLRQMDLLKRLMPHLRLIKRRLITIQYLSIPQTQILKRSLNK